MTSKRDLVNRWRQEPGVTSLKKLHAFCFNADFHREKIDRAEILSILRDVPYREEVPTGGDLRGARLAGGIGDLDLAGWDFSYATIGMNFIDCDLTSASFVGATIHADLARNKLDMADFKNAKINGVSLGYSRARRCCFDDANLTRAKFNQSDLTGSSFRNVIAIRAVFIDATLIGCNFRNAKLDNALILRALLDKTTDLRGASLLNISDNEYDRSGNILGPAVNWRDATYDETTVYGEDPAHIPLEILREVLDILNDRQEPEAEVLRARCEGLQASLRQRFDQDWSDVLHDSLTPTESALLETVKGEAYRNLL